MIKKVVYVTGAVFSLMIAGGAHAADTSAGKAVAQKLCINCHIVEPGGAVQNAAPDVPSFAAISDKAGQTEQHLRAFIMNPHPPMPEVQLTTYELDNIVAYILSLKDR